MDTPDQAPPSTATPGSARKNAGATRLLWRGGLEFSDGAVLEGIAFISHLSFETPHSSARLRDATSFPFPSGALSLHPSDVSSSGAAMGAVEDIARANGLSQSLRPSAEISSSRSTAKRAVLHSGSWGEFRAPGSPSLAPPSPFPAHTSTDLLISLGLESFKGRPTVAFQKTVHIGPSFRLSGTVDGDGSVRLCTDPTCPLVLNFVERQLLAGPSEAILDANGRTTSGILINLGDESLDSTTLVIYGRLSANAASSSSTPALTLHVGRWTPAPPSPKAPIPRPDDPAPRRPPSVPLDLLAKSSRSRTSAKRETVLASSSSKRPSSDSGPPLPFSRSLSPRSQSRSHSVSASSRSRPSRSRDSSMSRAEDEDFFSSSAGDSTLPGNMDERGSSVFGDEDVLMLDAIESDRTRRSSFASERSAGGSREGAAAGLSSNGGTARSKPSPLEASNKDMIKRMTVQCLAKRGVAKDHPDFKEVYSWANRGTGFALRESISTEVADCGDINRIILAHLDLYLPVTLLRKS